MSLSPVLRALACAAVLLGIVPAARAQGAVLPSDAVDRFHRSLRDRDTAGALSMLERSAIVFERGTIDTSAEAYAAAHLQYDIDFAVATRRTLLSRRTAGSGDERWVLSSYRIVGRAADGRPIDHVSLETAIVRRGSAGFRIVHLHWSTDAGAADAAPASAPAAAGR